MKHKLFIPAWSITLLMLLLAGCSSDDVLPESEVDSRSIELSARASDVEVFGATDLYIAAMLTAEPTKIYFGETLIEIPNLSTTTNTLINFPIGTPHYPLQEKEISLYAYSGRAIGNNMQLKSGVGSQFDALLSNQGTRKKAADSSELSKEGEGTIGNTDNPADVLHFRHAMTQIIVDYKIDDREDPQVNPEPTTIKLGADGIYATGLYSINAKAPIEGDEDKAEVAEKTSGEYQLQLGTNYVVPSGKNLNGVPLKSLVIDDYTATTDDLRKFIITPQGGATDFYLLPGYSYKLTLTISRLHLVQINISPISWQPRILTDNEKELEYDSYEMKLNLGSYKNQGEDQIQKVVLRTKDNKTYVGGIEKDSDKMHFLTVPGAGNVVEADLYTDKGLLLTAPITTGYTNQGEDNISLAIELSKAGMLKQDPNKAMSESNPYMVTTPLQFINIDKELSGHYKQSKVLDMSGLNVSEFKGLGVLAGSYNGDDLGISNLHIKGPGLFKENKGVIRGMHVYQGAVDASGEEFAGAFAGVNNGTIVSCYNEIRIKNSSKTAGGIVGKNGSTGVVLASVNNGEVSTGTTVGGIAGTNENEGAQAIAACINIGTLSQKATKLGGLIGTSVASKKPVLSSSYWLIGSASRFIGSKETAVESEGVGHFNTSSRDVNELRNGISEGETEKDRIVNMLNAEIAKFPEWSGVYQYILDRDKTGSTWPISKKK